MYKRNSQTLAFLKLRASCIALVIVWCISLAIGRFMALRSGGYLDSLFRSLTLCGVSCGTYFFFAVLPFALTYLVFRLKFRLGIYFLCFFKGICFSFGCCTVQYVFGRAGFLMNALLHLSGMVSMFLLLWIWIRFLRFPSSLQKQDFFICIGLLVLLYVADIASVFPFCQKLMNLL